jgi:uncharacterized membrane protein YfcA
MDTGDLLLVGIAFLCELVDSSLGMGYGTLLSPLLLLMGRTPAEAVPAVLLSQALGGGIAGLFHHKLGNARFSGTSRETRIMLMLAGLCVAAAVAAAFLGVISSAKIISRYIGVLVVIMGIVILSGRRFRFSWGKMTVVGLVSAFNKGLSGGGFGPVVAAGQVIVGQEPKSAVAITTAAEVPVCLASFAIYALNGTIDWHLLATLCVGAGLAGLVGPHATRRIASRKMHYILGALVLALGVATLVKS